MYSKLSKLLSCDPWIDESVIFQAAAILQAADALQNNSKMALLLAQFKPVDLSSLHVISLFRAALLRLQHFLMQLLDHIAFHPQVDLTDIQLRRQKYIANTHLLSREILDGVPRGLGAEAKPQEPWVGSWADGMRFLFPLATVAWMPQGLREHRVQAMVRIRQFGLHLGIKLALECDPPPGRFNDQ